MQGVSRRNRFIALATTVVVTLGLAGVASAHDEIESSVPAHQSQFDEPISEVIINFGKPVTGIELGLRGPDDELIPGEVTVLSDTEARLDFAELTVEGEYVVKYLAEEDGHLVAAAITFTYGESAGQGADAAIWIIFGVVALAILGTGAFFSVRRSNAPDVELDDAIPA